MTGAKNTRPMRRPRLRPVSWLAGLFAACLALPLPAQSQSGGIRDVPRATEIFATARGYADLSSDRYGTPADPRPNELGFLLVLRMFRTVCLGLENGEPLASVTPAEFSAVNFSTYFFGPDAQKKSNSTVLSPTGDIDRDEDGGHPAITLGPGPGGMTCRIEWKIADTFAPISQEAIAGLIFQWLPWEMSLIQASRPEMAPIDTTIGYVIDWDRPCLGRWCPMTALFNTSRGEVMLKTTLNITDAEGTLP